MRLIVNSIASVAVGLCVTACGVPSVTRTAVVKDVVIGDDLSPQSMLVHPGDEIRWINIRKGDVELDVPNLRQNELSCQRGFGNWLGQTLESVDLEPNDTASLCFKDPSVVHYVVRAKTILLGGKNLLSGSVSIVDAH